MSYRMCINGVQIFGNNEGYKEWDDYIKRIGIKIDDNGCYKGYIPDVMEMFEVIDTITRRLIAERHKEIENGETDWYGNPKKELTDLTDMKDVPSDCPLLWFNMNVVENAICFLPYTVFKAVEKCIERDTSNEAYLKWWKKDGIWWFPCIYKIKEGKKIRVSEH